MKTENPKTILLVDDDASLRRVLEFQLVEAGFQVVTAADGETALEIFEKAQIDCVITDLRMPKMSGLDLLAKIKTRNQEIPVIVITAFGDVETAVAAMRQGAFDFITKPFNRDAILLTLEKAFNFSATVAENRQLRRLVKSEFRLENVIGESAKIREVLNLVERVARTDTTVLITGESGTGKELIAKGIHFSGARADKPFVAVDCSAIPENLIEAELFGYKKGAFTGATAASRGKFEEADGGTIFLDEISAMQLALQTRLLRVLQEREIVRLGENTPKKIDVRVVAASNRNLETMVADGSFREDLYFRLAVVPIILPPLREKREDIPLLAEHFLRLAKRRHGLPHLKIEREVFDALARYDFPGNVRELENLIERMVVLSDGAKLTLADLPENVRRSSPSFGGVRLELPEEGISLENLEKEIIRRSLEKHGGNQSQAARYLDITRSALIYRMQKYGLAGEENGEN